MRKVKASTTHLNVRKVIAFRTLFFFGRKTERRETLSLANILPMRIGNILRNSTTQVQPCRILRTHSACISVRFTGNLTEAAQERLMPTAVPGTMRSLHKKQCWKALKGEAKDKEA